MKKGISRFLCLLLTLTIIVCTMPVSAYASAWDGQPSSSAPDGSGTAEQPYQLANAADLKWFADKVNGSSAKSTSALCAVLTDDINLERNEWTPIGYYNSYSDCVFYAGIFDGGGHTVSGLYINSDKQYQALIGYTKGATVKNLTVNGEVHSSAGSSSYASGIVAYGNPAILENCTNNADVSVSKKGYTAGVIAGTTGGSRLTGCINNGSIIGCGDFVGGITGSATGSSSAGNTIIKNCLNTGTVKNNGTPSSYAYSTGGIAGGISGGSTISMCGNTGDIDSTLKRTGGIAGSLGGNIEKCFNEGNIIGTYGVGGIAGDSSDKASSVISCYNIGSVKGKTPVSAFNDANTKGVGGIIGGVASNSYMASLKDCYNTGKILPDTSLEDVAFGGVIGDSSGKNYSGTETKNLVTASNCFYLDASAVQGNGRDTDTAGIAKKSAEEMKAAEFAEEIGQDYIFNTSGGYPLLGWQNPDTKYDITFTLSHTDASLTVTDAMGEVQKADGLTYHLKNGTYAYTVTCDECETVSGSFTVAYSKQTISISLKVKAYDFVFTTEPADAMLTVDGQIPLADGRSYLLSKINNPYTYQVSAFGYKQATGTITVSGNPSEDRMTVHLQPQEKYSVHIPYIKEDDDTENEVIIKVKSSDYPSAEITAQKDGSFSLPDGSYTYTISSAGYKSVKGSFEVTGRDVALSQAVLEIQTAWDGETITEPAQDSEGVYLITSPDEMIWYQKQAPLNSCARLMSDICINENIFDNPAYVWTPLGTNSSKAYTGTFDGNNHTLSGLYISADSGNAGVFGYVGTGGTIQDLTLSDSVIDAPNSNYVGAVVGDLKGAIHNCHTTSSVSVNGKSYVGGIVGELDSGAMVTGCSNAGSVRANNDAAGGIAGRVYSALSNALTDSCNTGEVTAARYAGGIAGMLYNNGTIENIYSAGKVTSETSYGAGLVGYFRCGTIRNAYAAGTISADPSGGAVGLLDWTSGQKTADTVYFLSGISDDAVANMNGCKIQGAIHAVGSAELKITAEALGDAFYENDTQDNNGYPLLYWQVNKSINHPDAPIPDPDGWNGKTSSNAPVQKGGIYQIGTPSELKWFARASQSTPDIQGVLTADIDLNYQPWSPIGGITLESAFVGIFDGNHHRIKNLYIYTKSASGLFGYNAGEIKNVSVDGIIQGADNTAAVAVYNNGKITNINTTVYLNGGNHTAGITAYNEAYGEIKDCRNYGNINGGQYTAGIASSNKGFILDSGNSGAITGTGTFTAGVSADNDTGTVKNCANSGNIIGKSAVKYAYVGGVVGRNDGTAQDLYNSGNVVSLGSRVGGCVATNTVGAVSDRLYNAGNVFGSEIETEDGADFRVGGAIGEIVSGVSNAYTLNTLSVTTGGTLVSSEELSSLAGSLTNLMPIKSSITGTVSADSPQAEDTITANYIGNAVHPIFVWCVSDRDKETVLSVSESYTIPANLVGYRLSVKVMDCDLSGVVNSKYAPIDGLSGSVKIDGYAVVGHTLNAVYDGNETGILYQWYRGTNRIEGATDKFYKITAEDEGKIITLRVTGDKPGCIEARTDKIQTSEQAGIWDDSQINRPQTDSDDVFLIGSEAELKWFASAVNGKNNALNAKLTDNITLTDSKWYPIGNSQSPYVGNFDGNSKSINNLTIHSESDEQGFFGNIGGKGKVKNLCVSGNIHITGKESISAGGIAGYSEGKITGCAFNGTISGTQNVGGIVGQTASGSVISQCINHADVSAAENVGGIVGSGSNATIAECVNTATIGNEATVHTGGIAGMITNYAVITACYNKGHVVGCDYMGGIAGLASVCAAPQGCYNIGKLDSAEHAFGVLGDLSGTDYISVTKGSYYLTDSALTATDKTAQGVNSDSMKKSAFVSLINAQSGAALFVMDIKNENGGYPLLLWQTNPTEDEENPEQPEILTVKFSLSIESSESNQTYTDWIAPVDYTVPNGTTAWDLFKKVLKDYGFTYEANGNSYISSITNSNGITLSELDNGPFSGWLYTINNEFPNYMESVKLKNADEMRLFYTNNYKNTGWHAKDPVVVQVMYLIDAIGTVTLDSTDAIRMARDAYEMLSSEQKFGVENKELLEEAEKAYKKLLEEKPQKDKEAAQTVDRLIDQIGVVTVSSGDAIFLARNAYNALTNDQKALVTKLNALENAESMFVQCVGEKTAADLEAANKVDLLIDAIDTVTVRSRETIERARQAFNNLTDEQKKYVTKEEILKQAEVTVNALTAEQNALRESIYTATGNTLLSGNIPTVSSVGGEWIILGLARSGRITEAFKTGYCKNLIELLNKNNSEKLHRNKSTENARAIIALSALGYNPTDIEGYNLLLPLADMDYLQKQGIDGPIWALIAFDTKKYDIPIVDGVKNQTTREKLIAKILSAQTEAGSWALDNEIGDIDLTAMAIQALAPYVNSNSAVKSAIDKALQFISLNQNTDGGFRLSGKAYCETCAQVIVALTSLGIDPDKDERFIKNGHSVLDAMLGFYSNGGFRHTAEGDVDNMPTEQAYYAMTAYYRFLNKQTALYDMSDVGNPSGEITEKSENGKTSNIPDDVQSGNAKSPEKQVKSSEKDKHTDKSNINRNTDTKSPLTGNNHTFFIGYMALSFAFAVIILSVAYKRKAKKAITFRQKNSK